jgi:hypothetical protein
MLGIAVYFDELNTVVDAALTGMVPRHTDTFEIGGIRDARVSVQVQPHRAGIVVFAVVSAAILAAAEPERPLDFIEVPWKPVNCCDTRYWVV